MSQVSKNGQAQAEYNPYIIAHRGYCSLFPENSLESIEAAILKCHYVQFDILLTKDNQIVIFHDRYLSKLTNVQEFPEFKEKKSKFVDDVMKNEETQDWWIKDFTKDQLKRLQIKQKSTKRPQLRKLKFTIPTLDEAIEEILYIKQHYFKDNKSGFLIQVKCAQEYKEDDQRDDIFAHKLVECLQRHGLGTQEQCKNKRFPIIIQSFNHRFLKLINQSVLQLPIVHLYDKLVHLTKEFLDERLLSRSMGIAISIAHATKDVMELCASKGLSVFFWTLKDDEPELLPPYLPTFKQAYNYLFSLGMNGIITEFPQKCEQYLNSFKAATKP